MLARGMEYAAPSSVALEIRQYHEDACHVNDDAGFK